jgi:hypothetical protein
MRRLLAVSILAASLTLTAPAHADTEGAVAVCNWALFEQYGHQGFNAHWMGCNWGLFGRVQCRGRDIPRCYTWAQSRHAARAFRAYTGLG